MVDNERYPARFEFNGRRFIFKMEIITEFNYKIV